jgi:putative two-component system response regulator
VAVEDDPLTGELLENFLKKMGARCYVFDHPKDFLRTAETLASQVDLFIFDLMLPQVSGLELLRYVKSHPLMRFIPSLVLTAIDDPERKLLVFENGADDYINKPVNFAELYMRVRGLLRLKDFHDRLEEIDNVLKTLVAIVEAKDLYTKGHSLRVAQIAEAIGSRLGMPPDQVAILHRAGLLHDIGKIVVDERYLNKPGPLTPEEMEIVKRHPEVGATILSQMYRTKPLVPLVVSHHERMDGSGYPAGKMAPDIPFGARILSVADVYDALTSDRPYRPALAPDRVLRIIEEEVCRGWWDPEAYKALVEVVTASEPLGTQRATGEGER